MANARTERTKSMELIERSALNEAIEEFFDGVCVYDVTPFEAVYDFQSIVNAMPAVDAVEVVRCKDCRFHYHDKYDNWWCGYFDCDTTIADGYCHRGDRDGKDGNDGTD